MKAGAETVGSVTVGAAKGAGPSSDARCVRLAGDWTIDVESPPAGVVFEPNDMNNDIHADARYRAHLTTVMTKRAVAAAG